VDVRYLYIFSKSKDLGLTIRYSLLTEDSFVNTCSYCYKCPIKSDVDGCVICAMYYPFCFLQLDLIIDLLGTPSAEDMHGTCEQAKQYVRSKGVQPSKLAALYHLSPECDEFAFSLMQQMLTFNPVCDSSLISCCLM
jgi:hypothetical protein